MFIGHYGVALAAKRVAPRTSLGTLILAAQWADLLWPVLLLLGVEHVRVVPGYMAANDLQFTSYPYSHSLAAMLVWGLVLGGTYYVVRRDRLGACIVGALVLSHWVLDLIVHAPDLALWPGSSVKLGLGLWNSVPGTLAAEFGLLLAGLAVYGWTTRPRDRVGRWALRSMVGVLVLMYLGGMTGAPPNDQRVIGAVSLLLWVFVPWGYWVDRHRVPRASAG